MLAHSPSDGAHAHPHHNQHHSRHNGGGVHADLQATLFPSSPPTEPAISTSGTWLVLCTLGIVACAAWFCARRVRLLRNVVKQAALALTLCILTTAQPILMEVAKARNHGQAPFHTPSMVFYTEALKMVVAAVVYAVQLPQMQYTGLAGLKRPTSVLAYAVPALLYAVQNNVNYFALQLIDPPTYQLWGCAKLVFAGGFFRVLLGRRLSWRQWLALCLLASGMAITTLKPSASTGASPSTVRGIALVLCTSALSGLSSVFNEWLIKFQDPKAPLMLKNFLLYAFGAAMCAGAWNPAAPLGDASLFVMLVVVQAVTGICVSLVLKLCDTLVKGFSTSGGVLFSTILSCALFGFQLSSPFAVGFTGVCAAFYLYFVTPSEERAM